uniref:Uncharacterized protein n=1 Tax=Ciona savignyi TaxID=51511 RepID=H2ZH80_CIOSA
MYKRMSQKKIFKNEPYNKFIVHTINDYHRFLPRIDVVMLCFAADNKKSLDQLKAIWQDLSPTRNMVNVPVVVIMTSSGKQSSIPQANFNNADQYTDSIKGIMLSVALNNETDVQLVFDEAYKRQDSAKRRFVKLPDVPFPKTS